MCPRTRTPSFRRFLDGSRVVAVLRYISCTGRNAQPRQWNLCGHVPRAGRGSGVLCCGVSYCWRSCGGAGRGARGTTRPRRRRRRRAKARTTPRRQTRRRSTSAGVPPTGTCASRYRSRACLPALAPAFKRDRAIARSRDRSHPLLRVAACRTHSHAPTHTHTHTHTQVRPPGRRGAQRALHTGVPVGGQLLVHQTSLLVRCGQLHSQVRRSVLPRARMRQ